MDARRLVIPGCLLGVALACGARTGLLVEQASDSGSTGCVTSIEAGNGHACLLQTDGSVWCFGKNYDGSIGTGVFGGSYCDGKCVPSPLRVSLTGPAVSVSAGGAHTCAALADGTAWCWGYNWEGALGDGVIDGLPCGGHDPVTVCQPAPVRVLGLTGVVQIAAGVKHSCALREDGTAWCWGLSSHGSLGFGSTEGMPCDQNFSKCVPAPIQVLAPGIRWVQIVTGNMHTCGRTADNEVYCWGDTRVGQCGVIGAFFAAPSRIEALGSDVAELASGDGHTCARKTDGTMWCWGLSGDGQLATTEGQSCESGSPCHPAPVQVVALGNRVASMAVGAFHSCALTTDQQLWCWGSGGQGELGRYPAESDPVPKPASQVGLLSLAASGGSFGCGTRLDGRLLCWGVANEWQPPVYDGSIPGPFTGLPPRELQVQCSQ